MNKNNEFSDVKLVYKPINKVYTCPELTTSLAAKDALLMCFDEDTIGHHESFKALLLNKGNRILGVQHVSEGGVDSTVVDPKIIMQAALMANASSVIICHNHPSGRIYPSEADKKLTNKLKTGMDLFDIKLLDHIILSPDGSYYSFADNGDM
jgi:DNA repair protein RadC